MRWSGKKPRSVQKVILHLDMDAFFAAVEIREDPSLEGKPLIIGRPGPRGVVSTCSYEARAFGVKSAMPSVTALRLCPTGVWRSGRMALYSEVSRNIMAILEDVSPVVQRVSIDEAFVDLSGIAHDLDHGAAIARGIKTRIVNQERLTASVGVSYNRLFCKIGSDLEKPDGLVVIAPADLETVIWPLPVEKIWGVGPKSGARLKRLGVHTIGDIVTASEQLLVKELGTAFTRHLLRSARGEDDSSVNPEHERKSISEERTYVEDLTDQAQIELEIFRRAEALGYALRAKELEGKTVHLKIRKGDYTTWTRSITLPRATHLASEIFAAAMKLYHGRISAGTEGVRLIGVAMSGLGSACSAQLELFPGEQVERKIAIASDAVRQRFGKTAITRASLIKKASTDTQPGSPEQGGKR